MGKRNIILLLTFVIFFIFILTGCSNKDNGEMSSVVFMYWTETPEEIIQYRRWLDEYTEDKEKKVQRMPTPIGGYEQKLLILFGAQNPPDLFFLTKERLPLYKDKGGLLPLDDYLKSEGFPFPDSQQYPELYGIDGKLYGIPINDHTVLVICSKTEKPEESWELLKFLLKKMGIF
ncbi:hypothetical protein BBF96_01595 [Anoxybacter fermentans]|uniref:ABC transporter substrate-binding protein n=1 Tax=Anoxybacter fermentans TaxID=1323375 RepID=A0A3Q9HNT7_9FIRM|nr:extracellular solute-binding protein [Anoxybacter fermentans]AZR72202.1 hypothetical protein BBF96_01595 [Anoxybacter fermentans]